MIRLAQRLLARRADDKHRPGSVRAAQQRAEGMAELPVDPDALDPVQRVGLLEPRHPPKRARRRHEETDTTPAGLRDRSQLLRRDLPPEGARKREPVQVDPEHRTAEPSLRTAAETPRELA